MSSPSLYLPPELIHDILSRFPVKDLLRFRSVSSSWISLIDSSYFTKLHLSRSQDTRSNLLLLCKDHRIFSLLDFHSLEKVQDLKQPPQPKYSPYPVVIVGSCNGLVVLCSSRGVSLSLWNPATRKFRQLPSPEIRVPGDGFELTSAAFGFGYDPEKDDYKLVQSNLFRETSDPPEKDDISEGAVFSLKSNTWRLINCPFLIGMPGISVPSEAIVNNAPHWALPRFPLNIVAFDLVKEEYYLVPLPESAYDFYSVCLSVLGGCLSIAIHPYTDPCVDVWVMNRYRDKDSWCKLFSWRYPSPSPSGYRFSRAVPVAYSRDGDKVLLNYNRSLAWYDFVRKTVEFVRTDCDEITELKMCVGSLVWPGEGRPQEETNSH